MTNIRVLSIFGTRPEAVKMAPIIRLMAKTQGVESIVCVTAQHREMLDQVLGLFEIKPDFDLDLMRPGQSLSSLTAAVFTHLDPVLEKVKPDWVLIQGDTTTVMAAALVSFYHGIRIGHVEAGLRTGDKWQPFPEEINRRVASVVADLNFAPTEWSRQNLIREHVQPEKIVVTGNPVIDALHYVAQQPPTIEASSLINQFTNSDLSRGSERVANSTTNIPRLILVTAHRRENFGTPIENICTALLQLAEIYADQIHIVYPVHLNPNIQEPVYRMLSGIANITLLPPVDYLIMVHLLKRATLLLTDSGGLQEEAPGLGVPVLVMREVTERPEGVEAGTVRLVGTDTNCIISESRRLLDDSQAHLSMARAINPYGDGHASERIVQALVEA